MELTGRTAIDINSQSITSKELKVLKQLLSQGALKKLLKIVTETYSAAQAFERNGQFREALQQISLAENELQRKIGPPSSQSAAWTQIRLDEKRLLAAVFGVPGSDGRVAAWHRHVFYESDVHPPPLTFYAWVRHGDNIYRHGGCPLSNERLPSEGGDCLWALSLRTKTWSQVQTSGISPGPRAGHIAVVYHDFMYTFGGRTFMGLLITKCIDLI